MTFGFPSHRASRINVGYSRGGFLSRMMTAFSLLLCLCCLPSVLEAQWTNGQSATYVIGQPDFISSAAATTQQGLNTPSDVEIDLANGKMYVADRLNNRILRYAYPVTSNYPSAEIVFGQPNFTSSGTGTSANTFGNAVRGIALDAAGNLYVADASNSRVLRFNAAYAIATNQPNANFVYGQPNFTSSLGATSQAGLQNPFAVAVDPATGDLFVADRNNHRIVRYPAASLTTNGPNANLVLGAGGYAVPGSTINAQNSTPAPHGIAFVGTTLYVGSFSGNRVTAFDNIAAKTNGANADRVLGQANFTASGAALSATGFNSLTRVSSDGANLYVADNANVRVVIFNNANAKANGAAADNVLGQADFTSAVSATTQNGLTSPSGIAYGGGALLVGDPNSSRVMVYTQPITVLGNVPPYSPRPTTVPLMNTPNVAATSNIDITFSQNVNAGTVTAPNFRVHGGFTGLKTAAYSAAGATATVNPTVDFRRGEQVWVTVTNAQSTGGASTRPFVMGFRTQAGAGPATLFQTANSGAVIGLYNTGGDITGDGNLDIVLSGGVVRIFAGDGAGNFAAPTSHGTNNLNRRKPTVGDFNNDGRLDVACGIFGGGVEIFLNTGAGLPALPNTTVGVAPHGFSVCAADFNGDGNMDVAAGDASGSTIRIGFGDGTGAFPVLGPAVGIGFTNANALWSGDMDGDGDMDILVSSGNGLSVLKNNGTGTMTLWQTIPGQYGPGDVADIDGNGTLDVVVGSFLPNVYVFRNTAGTGTLTADPPLAAGENVEAVSFADMDGINGPDIVAGDLVFRNNGSGVFTLFSRETFGYANWGTQTVGDYDNDGDVDVVASTWNSPWYFFKNGYQPVLTTFAPARNTNTAALAATIAPVYNQTMMTATASVNAFKVWGGFTGIKSTGLGYTGGGSTTPILTPPTPFRPGEQVWVTVTNAQTSLAGSVGIAARPQVYGFRTAAGVGPAQFIATASYPTAAANYGNTTADINNDGILDIIGLDQSSGNFRIRTGIGNGTFSAGFTDLPVNAGPGSVRAADFDNDGLPDLVANSNATNFLSLRMNTLATPGTFGAAVNLNVGASTEVLTVGDFNGDGNQDIAATGIGGTPLYVFLGNGNGTFQTVQSYAFGGSGFSACEAGDMDGDGDLDIVVGSITTNTLYSMLNDGTGKFTQAYSIVTGASGTQFPALGDVNGDGRLDVVVNTFLANSVRVFLGNGNGSLSGPTIYSTGAGSAPRVVILADFDGINGLDIATANFGSNTLGILLNNGSGTFGAVGLYPTSALQPHGITAGDFDGDGDMDILTGYGGNAVATIHLNTLPMTVSGNVPPYNPRPATVPLLNSVGVGIPSGSPMTVPMNTAGVNGIDITFSQSLAPWVFTNGASPNARDVMKVHGTTSRGYRSGIGFSGSAATLTFTTTANFNVGEQVWVSVTNAQSTVGIPTRPFVMGFQTRAGAGPATFYPTNNIGLLSGYVNAFFADLNGDGYQDIITVRNTANQVAIVLSTGPGTFAAPVTYGTGSTNPESVAPGDFDNDGDIDLAIANFAGGGGTGRMTVMMNNGAGAFGAPAVYASSNSPTGVVTTDVNADGYLDIVAVNTFGNNFTVFRNNGNGTFTLTGPYSTGAGTNPRGFFVTDVDNDGDIDVITMLPTVGQFAVFRNNGTGVFGAQANYATPATQGALSVGDINGDGYPDIVASPWPTAGNAEVRLNNGNGTFGAPTPYGPTLEAPFADVNGDGFLDLVTNDGTSTDMVRLNNGTGTFGAPVRSPWSGSRAPWHFTDMDGDGDLDMFHFWSNGVVVVKNGVQPVLTTLAPARNVNNAAVGAAISPTFTQTMTTGTASVDAFKVWGGFTGLKAGAYSGGGGVTPSLAPTTAFRPGEQVWVTVTNAQTSLTGSVGIAARPQVYGFRTQAGAGPGTFILSQLVAGGGGNTRAVAAGDWDNNGSVDLVMLNQNGANNIRLMTNNGAGVFTPQAAIAVPGTPSFPVAGDFDNDGNIDLIVSSLGTSSAYIFRNNPAGTLTNVGTITGLGGIDHIASADFNGDGLLDIVAACGASGVRVARNNGGMSFATYQTIAVPEASACAVGDFDSDGDMDIAYSTNAGNTVCFLTNDGNGNFSTTPFVVGAGNTPIFLSVGDLDNDGDPDVAVANTNSGTALTILENTSSGGVLSFGVITRTVPSFDITLADVNGDGNLDITTVANNTVYVLVNSGAGMLSGRFPLAASSSAPISGTTSFCLTAGDWDNDGDMDLATANHGTNNVSILFNTIPMTVLGNVPPYSPRPTTTPQMNTMNVGTPAGSPMTVPMNTAGVNGIDITFSQSLAPWVFTNGASPNARDAMKVHGTTSRGYRSGTGFSGAGATMTFTTTANFNPGEQVWVTVTNAQSTSLSPTRPFVMGFQTRAGAGPGTFYPTSAIAVGTQAHGCASGDFNGDGNLDVAVAKGSGNGVDVFLNTGTGSFAPAAYYATGLQPEYVVAGDFNNDGRLDLAVPNANGNNVSILMNTGAGTFLPAVNYGTGNFPKGTAVADFNGDGFMDIITANFNGAPANGMSVLLNTGTGTFFPAVNYATGGAFVQTCRAGDFDGDGDIDVVIANQPGNTFGIHMNNGNGTFAPVVNYGSTDPHDAFPGDLDGDGDLDLAVPDATNNAVRIYFNNGAGVFAFGATYPSGGIDASRVAVADFNGDGRLDVAVVNSTGNNLGILLNTGAGVFAPVMNYPTGTYPAYSVSGDFDGDGDLDLVVTNQSVGTFSIMKNGYQPVLTTLAPTRNTNVAAVGAAISPTFDQTMTTGTASVGAFKVWGGFTGLKAGTYSGGGTATPSLAPTTAFRPGEQVWVTVTNAQTSLVGSVGIEARPQVYGFRTAAGVGPGTFVTVGTPATAGGGGYLLLADVNNNGVLDMVTSNFSANNISVMFGTGGGAFGPATTYAAGTQPNDIRAADFNNDGFVDLAVVNEGTPTVTVRMNDGTGGFASSVTLSYVSGLGIGLSVADFNSDGNLDIAASSYGTNMMNIFFGNGNGTFQTVVQTALSGGFAIVSDAGDLDNDGDIDLVISDLGAAGVYALLNNGLGGFSVSPLYSAGGGTNANGMTLGDVSGDGILDVVVVTFGNNSVAVLRGVGDGTFLAADVYSTGAGTSPRVVKLADVDGVNGLDILVANNATNTFSVLLRTAAAYAPGTAFAPAVQYSGSGTAAHGIAAGDVDGDGDMDVVVNYGSSANASVHLNTVPMTVLGNVPPFTPRPTTTPLMNTMNVGTPAGSPMTVPMNTAGVNGIDITFSQSLAPWVFTNGASPNARDAMKVHGTTSRGYRSGTGFSGAGATMTFTTTANFNPGEQVWVTVTNAQSTSLSPTRPFVMGFQTRAGAGPGTFYPTPPVSTPSARNVRTADINGDGYLDLIVLRNSTNQVAIHLSTGPETFAAPVPYATGSTNPETVATGDFDNDGDIDLAISNFAVGGGTGRVTVLRNNGNGTFAAAVAYAAVNSPTAVVTADVNADGYLDIVALNTYGNNFTIHRNNGNGTFAGAVSYGAGANLRGVTVADVDNDGDIDVIVGFETIAQIAVFRNDGTGVFGGQTNYAAPAPDSYTSAGDVNGDGYIDLVLVSWPASANTQVRLNNGDGTFGAPTPYGTLPVSSQFADVNGDGFLDLVSIDSGTGDIMVRLNDGAGNFGAAMRNPSGLFSNDIHSLGDIDGDGDLDILRVIAGSVIVYKNGIQPVLTTLAPARNVNTAALAASISPTFTQTMTTGTASVNAFKVWGGFTGLKAGAYSGGGGVTPSLAPTVQFRRGEQVWVTVTNAQTSLTGSVGIAARPQVYGFRTVAGVGPARLVNTATSGVGNNFAWLLAGDITGDGNPDIIGTAGVLRMYAGDGAGNFAAPTDHGTFTGNRRLACTGDFNNDGRLDVVSAILFGGVDVFLNTGSSLPAAPNSTVAVGGSAFALCVADFNADGNMDFAVTDYFAGTVRIAFGNGAGGFPTVSGPIALGTANASALKAGDVDNDGDIDIIAGNASPTNNFHVLRNDGMGNFTITQTLTVGDALGDLADIDGNGGLDAAVSVVATGNVIILRNPGTGVFTADPAITGLSANAIDAVFADMDGLNGLDLVVDGKIYLNNGAGSFALFSSDGQTATYSQAAADFDNDGDMDIVITTGGGTQPWFLWKNMTPPTTYYYQSGNANNPANWNSLPWGGGTPATAFSSPAQHFIVMGGGGVTTASVIAPITIGANVSLHVTTPSVLAVGNGVTITNNGFLNVSGSTLQAATLQLVGSGAVTGNPVRYWSTNATLEYQTIAGTLTTNVELPSPMPGSVWVNGSNTVTLWGSTQINGAFTMQSGTFALGANTLTLNAAATFVGGNITGGASSGLTITGAGNLNGAMALTGGLQTLTMFRAGATLTLGAPLDVTGTLTLTQGYVKTTATNILSTTNPLPAAIGGGGTTSHVVGPIVRSLPTVGGIFDFPVGGGTGTTYLPLSLNFASAAGAATYEVESLIGASGGTETGLLGAGTLSTTEYWRTALSGNALNTATLTFTRTTPALIATNRIGESATASGTYTGINANDFMGSAVAAPNISNVTAFAPLNTGTSFYAIGGAAAPPLVTALSPTRNNPAATPLTSPIAITFSQVLTAFSSRTWGSMTGRNMTATSFAGNIGTQSGNTFKPGEKIHTTVMTGTSSAAGFMTAPHVFDFVGEAVNGTGTLYRTNGFSVGTSSLYSSAVADVDKDGNVDAIIIEQNAGSARIQVARGDGMGGFLAPIGYLMSGPSPQGRFVTTGDFNNDGWIDIVAANNGDSKVDVFINNGSGGFGAPVIVPTAFGLVSVVTADFNGDGNLDIAATSFNSHEINVYSGNGGGGFALLYNVTLPLTPSPNAACAGDFDNDGDMDFLVFANNGSRYTFRNNGAGSFVVTSVAGTGATPKVFDMDGDGDVDIVYEGGPTGVAILENDGTGNFPITHNIASGLAAPYGLAVGNFDNDPRPDIFCNDGTRYMVLRNTGAWAFTQSATGSPEGVFACSPGDFDNDGDLDIFALGSAGGVLLKNGSQPILTSLAPTRHTNTATLAASIAPVYNQTMTTATASVGAFKVWGGFTGIKAGTYSGGGSTTPSLAPTVAFLPGEQVWVSVTQAQTSVVGSVGIAARPTVYSFRAQAGVGPGTFQQVQTVAGGGGNTRSVAAGDWDNNGILDLVMVNQNGSNNIRLMMNNGAGSFTPQAPLAMTLPSVPVVRDFDNDGNADIIVSSLGTSSAVIFRNFPAGTMTNVGSIAGLGGLDNLAAADFNGDGLIDIVASCGPSGIRVARNNGGMSFTTYQTIPVGNAESCAVGDVDNDGDVDIVYGTNAGNTVGFLVNDGFGNFSTTPFVVAPGNTPIYLSVGDVDNDGDVDVVVGNINSGAALTILENTTSGGILSFGIINRLVPSADVHIADYNGDGSLDIVSVNNNTVYALLNAGAGTLTARFPASASSTTLISGTTSFCLASGDWDGDGDMDIATANHASNDVSVLFNQAAPTRAGFGNALSFNGINQSVNAGAALAPASPLTLEAWINPTSFVGGGHIVGKNNVVGLSVNAAGNLVFQIGSGAVWLSTLTSTTTVPLGTWSHVAARYDGATMTLYLNGVAVGSLSTAVAVGANASVFSIGALSGAAPFFTGAIDEVRVWNTALVQNVVSTYHGVEIGTTHPNWGSLVSYWRLNEYGGASAADSKGVNTGTLLNAPVNVISQAPVSMVADPTAGSVNAALLPATVAVGLPTYSLVAPASALGTVSAPIANAVTFTNLTSPVALNATDTFGYQATDGVTISTATMTVRYEPRMTTGGAEYAVALVNTPLTTPTVVGGTGPLTWQWSPATSLSATNVASPIFNGAAGQAYTVTVTDALGFSHSTAVTVSLVSGAYYFRNGDASVPSNWLTNYGLGVPAASLTTPGTTFIVMGNGVLSSTIATANATFTLGAGVTMRVQAPSVLTVDNGMTLINNGTLIVEGTASTGGTLRFVGNGTITGTAPVYQSPMTILQYSGTNVVRTTTPLEFPFSMPATVVVDEGVTVELDDHKTLSSGLVLGGLLDIRNRNILLQGRLDLRGAFIANNFSNVEIGHQSGTPAAIQGTFTIATNVLSSFTMNRPASVLPLGSPMLIQSNLSMMRGILRSDTTNYPVLVRTNSNAVVGGSDSSFVEGPMRRYFPTNILTSGSGSWVFPTGRAGKYLPFTLIDPRTGGDSPLVEAEAFNGAQGGTMDGTLSAIGQGEYWNVRLLTGDHTQSRAELGRFGAFVQPIPLGSVVAKSPTRNGIYTNIGGSVSGNQIQSSTFASFSTFTIGTPFSAVAPSQQPTITNFGPTIGTSSTILVVNGTNLSNLTGVRIGGVPVSFTVVSSTRITLTLSPGTQTGPITLQTATSGSATSFQPFTFIGPPTMATVSPEFFALGQDIIISGNNFYGTPTSGEVYLPVVRIGGITASSVEVLSPTQMRVRFTVAATGNLTVQSWGGIATTATVVGVLPPPTLLSFAPGTAAAGETITLRGTDFRLISSITIGGVPVTNYTLTSSTSITLTVPAGAGGTTGSGFIRIQTSGGTALSGTALTIIAPPSITGFSPTVGSAGQIVEISGTNFSGTTAVRFGNTTATFVVSADGRSIRAIIPNGVSTGASISVSTRGGTVTATQSFGGTPQLNPTITGFEPVPVVEGGFLTVRGINFPYNPNGQSAVSVFLGGVAIPGAVYTSSTTLTFRVPSGVVPLTMLSTQAVLSIQTPQGITSALLQVPVFAPDAPVITGFTPEEGDSITTITIEGRNFGTSLRSSILDITIGGVPVQSFVIQNSRLIVSVVGNVASGAVVIRTPLGAITTTATFRYTGAIVGGVARQDSLALVTLYSALGGTSWTQNTNWLRGFVGSWYGVTVEGGRVRELRLPSNNLRGTVSSAAVDSSLARLDGLRALDLSGNGLNGTLPRSLSKLKLLETLNLGKNNLTGNLKDLCGLLKLRDLDISNNALRDSLSNVLCCLINLERAIVSNNRLYGSIPLCLLNLERLSILDASANELSDSLPSGLGTLRLLTVLNLRKNRLTGALPAAWGNNEENVKAYKGAAQVTGLTGLQILDLGVNAITGGIPDSWATLTGLRTLALDSNRLSGVVPEGFAGLVRLQTLLLSKNALTNMPDLRSIIRLNTVAVDNNAFEFGPLENNRWTPIFRYAPQAEVGQERKEEIALDGVARLSLQVSGERNWYEWRKRQSDGTWKPIAAKSTTGTVVFASFQDADAGVYRCYVSNPLLPNLTLISREQTLLAVEPKSAPPVPILIAPERNETTALRPTLVWTASEGAASYTAQIATQADFGGAVSSHDVQQTLEAIQTGRVEAPQLAALRPSTTYHWRVVARNRFGESVWSTSSTFVTTDRDVAFWARRTDFGRIPRGDTAFAVLRVQNVASSTATLVSLESSDVGFRVESGGQPSGGTVFQAGEVRDYTVRFTPDAVRRFSADIRFDYSVNGQRDVWVHSERLRGIGSALKLVAPALDTILIGLPRVAAALLINRGNVPVDITQTRFRAGGDGVFQIKGAPDSKLGVGDTATILIRCEAKSIGALPTALLESSGIVQSTPTMSDTARVIVRSFARLRQPSDLVARVGVRLANNINNVPPGTTVPMELYLASGSVGRDMLQQRAEPFINGSIRYGNQVLTLAPQENVWRRARNSGVGNRMERALMPRTTIAPNNSLVLAQFNLQVVAGETDTTGIEIEDLRWQGVYLTEYANTNFRARVSQAGGKRLIAGTSGGIAAISVAPNPSRDVLEIVYTLAKDGFVTLSLLDVRGQEVGTILSQVQPKGTHTLPVRVERFASGSYTVRLRIDGEESHTQQIQIVR